MTWIFGQNILSDPCMKSFEQITKVLIKGKRKLCSDSRQLKFESGFALMVVRLLALYVFILQDSYAIKSCERGVAAQKSGAFAWEIVPVRVMVCEIGYYCRL